MNYEQRIERLHTFIAEDRLIRKTWTGEKDGWETACLLAALSPEVGEARDISACPADVMPLWFAHLVPWMDDEGSLAAWPGMVRRFADLASRWHALNEDQWTRLDYRVRSICVREARSHTDHAETLAVIDQVLVLLDRVASGDVVKKEEWAEGRAAAAAATRARMAAARTTWAAEAWVARVAAAWAGEAWVAAAGAWVAARAAEVERATSWEETVDRMTTQIFDAIEEELRR